MFERRLKIFLAILVAVTGLLVLRSGQVQVWQKAHWQAKADEIGRDSHPIETIRGKILDVKGRELAIDRPCIDACIHFQAIVRDPQENEGWVRTLALQRVRARLRDGYAELSRGKKRELLDAEAARVRADIDGMWAKLAKVSGQPIEQIVETRDDILKRVTMRRRHVWYRKYELAMRKHAQREPAPRWRSWLIDETANAPTLENFTTEPVKEETEAHPILTAISPEVQNELRKHIEDYPGLVFRAGIQRYYPFGGAGCHLIGHLARVKREDLRDDPNFGRDERRQYLPNDLIGRAGLERLAEPLLRGSRGTVETIAGRTSEVGRVDYVPGRDVSSTIDILLQQDITNMFRYAKIQTPSAIQGEPPTVEVIAMHGAAIVIDLPTAEVRALVSYPTYDLNEFDNNYSKLAGDTLNKPMLNRATKEAHVPGSTVKPIVGLAAITDGLIGANQGIECTGYLAINGNLIRKGFRCWVVSKFANLPPDKRPPEGHHKIPWADPHVGHDGNPDGFLTFSDALQRSCNVYFETLGDRLRIEGLSRWYFRFGLGQPTGLGIGEARGQLPWSYLKPLNRQQISWHSSIGQVQVTATPIQMANVAATIARGGIWMRPKLLRGGQDLPELSPTTAASDVATRPDLVDLQIHPDALAGAREGMIRVVNSKAGTGQLAHRDDMVVAGKTGTATATPIRLPVKDAEGNVSYEPLRPSTKDQPNPAALWYRAGPDGTVNHAWFIGFAPAENPKIAFAVLVEYGSSGGATAGSVVRELLQACVDRGYLNGKKTGDQKSDG